MDEKRKDIIENYVSSYNSFDVEGMTKDLHSKVQFQNITNGKVNLELDGIEQFKNQAESTKKYFKERKQSIKSWDFENNSVKIEVEYSGILAVSLRNGFKSGATVEVKGQSEFEFEDEKIIKIIDKT